MEFREVERRRKDASEEGMAWAMKRSLGHESKTRGGADQRTGWAILWRVSSTSWERRPDCSEDDRWWLAFPLASLHCTLILTLLEKIIKVIVLVNQLVSVLGPSPSFLTSRPNFVFFFQSLSHISSFISMSFDTVLCFSLQLSLSPRITAWWNMQQ